MAAGAAVSLVVALAAGGCGDGFSEGGSGNGGVAGTTSATTTSSNSGGSSSTSTPSGAGGTGGVACPHGVCDPGEPLDTGCEPCVATICEAEPPCCTAAWTLSCVYAALHTCHEDCAEASCESQYGTPGNNLAYCSYGEDECEMEVAGADSCLAFCRQNGGECLRAYDTTADECTPGTSQACMSSSGSGAAICVCSRGCGTTTPCASGEYCDGGSCLQQRVREREREHAGSPQGS